MFGKSVGLGTVAALALFGCGSVSGSDSIFWRPADGFAGAQGLIQNAGAGGAPMTGGAGGLPGTGGYPAYGGAYGSGGIPNLGGTTSTGGYPFGTGGDLGSGGTGGIQNTGTGGVTNSGKCGFTFDVTTVSYGGRFRPRNVGAIYVETSSGGFVKSLNVWGYSELHNLTDWEQESGGNTTDAVTSATRANAGPVSGSWDCTDTNRQPVADGQYQACCSFQEDDALPLFGPAPKKVCIGFTKGTGPFTLSPPDQAYFTNMTLTMQ